MSSKYLTVSDNLSGVLKSVISIPEPHSHCTIIKIAASMCVGKENTQDKEIREGYTGQCQSKLPIQSSLLKWHGSLRMQHKLQPKVFLEEEKVDIFVFLNVFK